MRDSVILLPIKTNSQSDIFIYSVSALLSARLLFVPLRYFDWEMPEQYLWIINKLYGVYGIVIQNFICIFA